MAKKKRIIIIWELRGNKNGNNGWWQVTIQEGESLELGEEEKGAVALRVKVGPCEIVLLTNLPHKKQTHPSLNAITSSSLFSGTIHHQQILLRSIYIYNIATLYSINDRYRFLSILFTKDSCSLLWAFVPFSLYLFY